jgi:hypothetical protein
MNAMRRWSPERNNSALTYRASSRIRNLQPATLRKHHYENKANRVQTVPGKGWNVMLRFYSPLEPFFDRTWKPGKIEVVK